MTVRLRVLSLGAGVQSTTLALMAAHGEIERPDCAIFADTQWEPAAVYRHLDWLGSVLPFPVRRVTAGDIQQSIRERRNTSGGRFAALPWHIVNPDGTLGMGRRQCSSEYKLTPIMREIRSLLGKGRHEHIAAGTVDVLLGISLDEAHRMRQARQRYMTNRYPLVDLGMRRWDCMRWLERHQYPVPSKSACIGCPFHDNSYWRRLRDTSPDEWQNAIQIDRELRCGDARGMHGVEYMHYDRVPLDEVDLSIDTRQADLFGNDCEGLCGV
ncbi:MAG TPA: hypothetical protein VJ890_05980 [Vineibacter sp.]|nr:hypothetical protein [Vineibacter sp.]